MTILHFFIFNHMFIQTQKLGIEVRLGLGIETSKADYE